MGRTIGAVVLGVVLWGVLWNGGNAGLGVAGVITVGEPISSVPVLLGMIAYSAVLSLLAGYVAAAVKGGADAMTAAKAAVGSEINLNVTDSNRAARPQYWSFLVSSIRSP